MKYQNACWNISDMYKSLYTAILVLAIYLSGRILVLRWCSGLRSKENVDACQNISCVKHPILTYHLFIDYIPCEYICVFDIDSINEWYYKVSCLGGYLGLLIISLFFHRMFSRYIKSAIVWYTCFYSFDNFLYLSHPN